jgi:ribosomal protein S12 methylthiotransferase accessory factor YcaO
MVAALLRATLLLLSLVLFGAATFAAETGANTSSTDRLVYVTVAGAPGDGEQALTKALYEALAARGVKQAGFNDTNVYEIEVIVRVEPDAGGKQSVKINWIVFDAEGNTLGHVSQSKSIRKGSLDKSWGPAAKAAAGAASGEIMELLKQK